ncbi:hypothetical protein FDECE_10334 [Fusarium decemcellulare]|nr:hypothetical protein FDECE_10334 [Fusarium decemcellulare]
MDSPPFILRMPNEALLKALSPIFLRGLYVNLDIDDAFRAILWAVNHPWNGHRHICSIRAWELINKNPFAKTCASPKLFSPCCPHKELEYNVFDVVHMALTTAISLDYTEAINDMLSYPTISINFPLSCECLPVEFAIREDLVDPIRPIMSRHERDLRGAYLEYKPVPLDYIESLPDQERASWLPPEFEEQRVIEQTSLMHYKFLDGLREAIQDDQDVARPLLEGILTSIGPLLEVEKNAEIATLVRGTGHRLMFSLVEAAKGGKENMTKRLMLAILALLEFYGLHLTQGDSAKNLKLILDLARTKENDIIARHIYDFMTFAIAGLWDRGARDEAGRLLRLRSRPMQKIVQYAIKSGKETILKHLLGRSTTIMRHLLASGTEDEIIHFTHFGLGWLCLHFPRDTAGKTPHLVISHVRELTEMIVTTTAVQRVEAFAFETAEELCNWITYIPTDQDRTLGRLLKTILILVRFLLESHLASESHVRFIKLVTAACSRFMESFIDLLVLQKRPNNERILQQHISSLSWLLQTLETVGARDTLVKTATTLGLHLSFKCLIPWSSNEVIQAMLPAHAALIGALASVSEEDQAVRMFDQLLFASLFGMDATEKGMELTCFLDMKELFADLWYNGHGTVVEKLLTVRRHRLEPFICWKAETSSAVGMELLVNANSDSRTIHQSLLEEGAEDAVLRAALGADFTAESFSKQSLMPCYFQGSCESAREYLNSPLVEVLSDDEADQHLAGILDSQLPD